MVHGSEGHLLADLLAKCDESNSENSSHLVNGLFLVLLVLSTEVEHPLDFEHVARPCEGTGLDY